jgi:hypothetical protein
VPQLNEIIANREKKRFVKRNYRAYDMAGTGKISPSNLDKENNAVIDEYQNPISLDVGSYCISGPKVS